MNGPKVSIIIPVYNSERFLAKTLRSAIGQTYQNKEIIIIDDSSTDNSYQIAKKNESVICKVLKQQNGGAAAARNEGLRHATGEYIQFLDSDDFLSDDKIEKQIEAIKEQKSKVAVCNYIEFNSEHSLGCNPKSVDQSSFIYSSDNPADFLVNLYGGNNDPHFIQTNCWLIPKSLIEVAGTWRDYRCPDDDGEFFARILLASNGIVYVAGILNFYRKIYSEKTLSSNTKKKYVQNTLLTIDLKHNYLSKFHQIQGFNKAIATQYLNFAVYTYPRHKALSKIAFKRFKTFHIAVPIPKLGGKAVELIKATLGWKAARLLRYYLREK